MSERRRREPDRPMIGPDAFKEDWRVACPEGHVRLEPARATETAYCESCERSYDWEDLVDRKAASVRG